MRLLIHLVGCLALVACSARGLELRDFGDDAGSGDADGVAGDARRGDELGTGGTSGTAGASGTQGTGGGVGGVVGSDGTGGV